MDIERFTRELPRLFDDFPHSEVPRDRRFADLLEAVPGLARPNNLALLNLAVACLDPGEAYVEAGSFRGTSLVAAGLGNDAELVAIDDFSKSDASRADLDASLETFGVEARVVEGDALAVLRGGALSTGRVGVFYYDADHAYESQLAALRLAQPHLADRALVIVDDSDWDRVAHVTRDYLAGEPRARLLFDLPGEAGSHPWWWHGMQVLACQRPGSP